MVRSFRWGVRTSTTDTGRDMADSPSETRIDKWLWAARFFKTRSLATAAVAGGRIEINGEGAKPSKSVKPGDRLRIRIGPVEYRLVVKAIAERRGTAPAAQALYDESPESLAARETIAAQRRFGAAPAYEEKGRPSKKDRRQMNRWKGE
jgi:ribosome-associated heat shock protein Hsp15